MTELFEIFPGPLFDQDRNVQGGSFNKLKNSEKYTPNTYTFHGNPINFGLKAEFNSLEEELIFSLDKARTKMPEAKDKFPEKGIMFGALRGDLFHEDGSKAKKFIIWNDIFYQKNTGILPVKLKSNVRKGIRKGEFVILPQQLFELEEDGRALTSDSSFGAVKLVKVSPYEWKLFISVNSIYPNYNDIVLNMTSVHSPLASFVTII